MNYGTTGAAPPSSTASGVPFNPAFFGARYAWNEAEFAGKKSGSRPGSTFAVLGDATPAMTVVSSGVTSPKLVAANDPVLLERGDGEKNVGGSNGSAATGVRVHTPKGGSSGGSGKKKK